MDDTLSCGEALMQLLAEYDVDTVFGMPGTQTLELYRGIARAGIRHVQCRNEQGASLMADGYARTTGKPGVCTIVTGPGVTNAATGIAQAYCDSQPMLVLSGAGFTRSLGKGWGTVHELDDQCAVTASFTAFSAMVHQAGELPELVARAFAVFRGSRPRPVHLSLPWDVMPQPAGTGWAVRRAPSRAQPDPAAITEAAQLLAQARRPLLLLGGGALGTGESARAIAERIGAVVLTSNAGKGIVPESHPLSLGCSILQKASQEALSQADVVLLVGCQVAEGDHFLPRLEIAGAIVRIDIDPRELTAQYGAAVAIQSDARPAMAALDRALAQRQGRVPRADGETWAREIRGRNAAAMTVAERRHARVWQVLRQALPADALVIGDMSQLVYSGSFAFPVEQENCWIYSGTYCALGVALPMAIGARIGAPARPVLAVAGDGGLMFTVNELATAAQERLALPVIVWNNDALGEIADQMDQRGIPRVGVEPPSPDFVKLAESLGCHGVRASGAQQLSELVGAAFRADRPTVIEVRQDSPWLAA